MGLTRIGVFRYWWVSQLAMLPATIIFLNAGRELGKVTSLRDILSPGMVFAFTLLGYCRWSPAGCFPVFSRLLKVRHYAPCAFCTFLTGLLLAAPICRRRLAGHSATG